MKTVKGLVCLLALLSAGMMVGADDGVGSAATPAPTPAAPNSPAVTTPVAPAADLTAAPAPAAAPTNAPSPTVAAGPASEKPAAEAVAREDKGPLVIEYIEADVQNVLRTLAARASVNLILGDEVIGKVTVHLEDISYEEAIRLIAESKGYAFVKQGKVVKVVSKQSLEAEPIEVRTRVLNYAKADEAKKTLDAMLTSRGRIQVDVRSNTLVISDTSTSLDKVMPLIDTLDTQTTQVMIEAKFVETSKNPHKDLGFDWSQTLVNHELSAGTFSLTKDLGAGGWTPSTAVLDAGQAKVVFSYLNTDSDAELLANPRVVTTDNSKAKISISTQFPIPQFSFSEQTASFRIQGFEWKEIGIILNVTPRINKNEFVTLEVVPEASSSTRTTTIQGIPFPIIDMRQASTTVLIKSGNTLVIGGLMRQDASDKYTKVPVMGDIPGLGAFFRSKSLDKKKLDLLIFLTPTIVSPESQADESQLSKELHEREVYANDRWMPRDNAKPGNLLNAIKPNTAQQNFNAK